MVAVTYVNPKAGVNTMDAVDTTETLRRARLAELNTEPADRQTIVAVRTVEPPAIANLARAPTSKA